MFSRMLRTQSLVLPTLLLFCGLWLWQGTVAAQSTLSGNPPITLATPFPTPSPSTAPQATWARWVVSFDFRAGQVDARWKVSVGYRDTRLRSQPPVTLAQQEVLLPCTPSGEFTIQGGRARLNGVNAYLACDLPSYRETVRHMAPNLLTGFSDRGCECINPRPYVGGDLILGNDGPRANPLFYHPDFQFNLPTLNPNEATLQTVVNGQPFASAPWLINPQGQQIFAGIVGDLMLHEINPTGPAAFLNTPDFLANAKGADTTQWFYWVNDHGKISAQQSLPPAFPITISAEPTTIYLGYNPATGEFAQAEVAQLVADPGCKSN
jgi:hypothetical protein